MKADRLARRGAGAAALALVLGSVVASTPARGDVAHLQGANEFDEPSGLVFGGGHLWVANEAGNSITEINPADGTWITTIGRASGYRFNRPDAIATVGADLFVVNAGGSVTEATSATGTLVRVVSGSRYRFSDPLAIASLGNTVLVLNAGNATTPGSITEFNGGTGTFIRNIAGASFDLDDPVAFSLAGSDAFVADEGNDSVTEVDAASGTLVGVVSDQGLDDPDGIAVVNGDAWIADSGSNAVTEIDAASDTIVSSYSDADGSYGFGQPSTVIAAQGNVYVMTPFGSSPMVTKVLTASGAPAWYMCNTNGPYYFSLLSAFAVSGDDLWVASRSGANSQTPAAATGSLTEMLITTGALVATLPPPPPGTTTTTTTTTTTP